MADDEIERATRSLGANGRVVLAVSGGRDSMVLLDAAARTSRAAIVVVATFDHATGPAARRAVKLVRRRAQALGLQVTSGRARTAGRSEAALRAARWDFLEHVGAQYDARVATAHTRDDQLETVVMRILRGAGARGLAGLCAPSRILRPLLGVSRASVATYAGRRNVEWIDDPTNDSPAFLRNRVRRDLLPALLAARPDLAHEIIAIGERAAELRRSIDFVIAGMQLSRDEEGAFNVATASLSGYDPTELRALWPAIAARAAVRLDRRGTERLARFTNEAAVGDRMQLSGPVDVVRRRETIALLRARRGIVQPASLTDGTVWGRWRFHIEIAASKAVSKGGAFAPWSAMLDVRSGLRIRAWTPGDRMRAAGDAVPRRVKRFLRDAGLAGPDRHGWPVVLAGDEIVWIPGVRRSDAATVRPGRPGALYVCDRIQQHGDS